MKLFEAKEILRNKGYKLIKENSNDTNDKNVKSTFKQWYTAVADVIEKHGYDEVILSVAMKDKQMSKTIIDMYDEDIKPIQAALEVIDWSDSKDTNDKNVKSICKKYGYSVRSGQSGTYSVPSWNITHKDSPMIEDAPMFDELIAELETLNDVKIYVDDTFCRVYNSNFMR